MSVFDALRHWSDCWYKRTCKEMVKSLIEEQIAEIERQEKELKQKINEMKQIETNEQLMDSKTKLVAKEIVDIVNKNNRGLCLAEYERLEQAIYNKLRPRLTNGAELMETSTAKAILSEKQYQDRHYPVAKILPLPGWIIVMDNILSSAKKDYSKSEPNGELNQVRKLATCALRCMDQHGAIERTNLI